jgi:hypothetical protein
LASGRVLSALPAASATLLTGRALISGPFRSGLHVAFAFSVAACLIAAAASWSRGKRYVAPEQDLTGGRGLDEAEVTAEIETDVATDA